MRRKPRTSRATIDGHAAVPARAGIDQVHAFARRQHGVVTREQLLRLGMTPGTIDRRLASKRLGRMHRGVYLIGPVAPPRAREMGAVLACGQGAVLSHRNAAYLHDLLPHPADLGPIHITVPGRGPGPKPGIRVHEVTRLPAGEITRRDGIPVTTAARTILDLALDLPSRDLEQAIAEAHRRDRVSKAGLERLIAHHSGRAGTRVLRELLEGGDPALLRSRTERRMRALIQRSKLPRPRINSRVGPFEIDLLWPQARLAVEVDGYPFHSARPDRERDHARDAELIRRGYRLIRVSRRQILHEPEATVALIARELGPARPSPPETDPSAAADPTRQHRARSVRGRADEIGTS